MVKKSKFVKGTSIFLVFIMVFAVAVGFAAHDSGKTKEDSYSAISEALDKIAEATATINGELEWLRSNGYEAPEIEDKTTKTAETAPIISNDTYSKNYTEQDAIDIAKILYTECRGVPSKTEQACVVWTVLNRVDNRSSTIYKIVRERHQFAFYEDTPVRESLLKLAYDVLDRWSREKNGETDVGRVLPQDYEYFNGDGLHNHFRNNWDGNYSVWDYSYDSPYSN